MTIKKLKSIDIINVLSDLVSDKLKSTVKLPSLVDGESSWEPLNEVFRKVIEKNSDDMF